MPHEQFSAVTLRAGNRVEVRGPFDPAPGDTVLDALFCFVIAQGDAVAAGQARGTASEWRGDATPVRGTLAAGDAAAVGVAMVVLDGTPPTFETSTWSQAVTVTAS
jgi:hypothetical protein